MGLTYATPGHSGEVKVFPIREQPTQWLPQCSCGWVGVRVHEPWFTPGDEATYHFAEPYNTVAKKFGPEQLIDGVYGRQATALVQVLTHVGYDPKEDLRKAAARFEATRQVFLAEADAAKAEKLHQAFSQASLALVQATARERVMLHEPNPTVAPRSEEAQAILQAHQAEEKKRRDTEANPPFTAEEQAFWDRVTGVRR